MRKRTLFPLVAGGMMVAAGTVAWLNRASIAQDYVDTALAERGVRATYAVDAIGIRQQRLRDIVVGDPARPDLVAREAEVTLGIGWSGPYVTAVRARGVRLNARWTGERLTLGEVDKLLPEPDGGPFAFPAIDLDIADASARVDTPWGRVGLAVAGRGRLDGRYSGDVAVSAPALALGGCTVRQARGRVDVRLEYGAPQLQGPLGIARVACGTGFAASDLRLGLDANSDAGFSRLRSRTGFRGGPVRVADARAARVAGQLTVGGAPDDTLDARWQITASNVVQPWAGARQATIDGGGSRQADGRWTAASEVALRGGRTGRAAEVRLASLGAFDDSTPIGPIARKLAAALRRAGSAFGATGAVRASGGTDRSIRLAASSIDVRAASGARLLLQGDEPVQWNAVDGLRVAGTTRIAGGGLPPGSITLDRVGAGVSGTAQFEPYAAEGAALALAPVRFEARGGRTRFTTGVAITGPFGDGAVDRLALPLAGVLGRDGTVMLNPGCRSLRWQGLRAAGLALDPGAVRLCSGPGSSPLGWSPARGLSGALTAASLSFSGRTGSTPIQLAAGNARLSLATLGGALRDVDVQVGRGDGATRFRASEIAGTTTPSGAAGTLRSGAGKIGPTPFLLSGADGDWQWSNGTLQLDTSLTVDDAASDARFQRLVGDRVAVRYADGAVRAQGMLREANSGAAVLDLTVDHRFATSSGSARFTLAGLNFTRDGLQPVDISRLALGVVANVDGRVDGGGDVRWTQGGVTSGGSFSTDRLDLAAAFGPVERLSGTIRFDDLLALTTPPGQEARVGSINPGIEVTDGRILYQMLPDRQVRIESGTWPFAGGQLLLQPTLLDLGTDRPRRLTFDVANVDAALFLERYDFENISATGIFDGVMPTVFDADGGRVVGGSLVSRDGGGTLAYVGELSNRDLGVMANMAYGALKSLRYDNLVIRLNGDIDGEMVTEVDFSGLAQGEGAERNLLTRAIARLPFTFRIRINAPFRQLLSSARGLYDPTTLIEQNLPDLLRAERDAQTPPPPADRPSVQPSESEDRR